MVMEPVWELALNIAQTLTNVVVAGGLIIIILLLRHEVRHASEVLAQVFQWQQTLSKRLDALEMRQGMSNATDSLARLKRLADAIDQAFNEDKKEQG